MIYVVSDYPDKLNEDKPLGDPHGAFFWHLMYSVGLNVRDMEISYLWPDFKSYTYDYDSYSVSRYRGDGNIIIPLGSAVCKTFGVMEPISKIRGSVIDWHGSWLVPTFHPRELKSPYLTFAEEPILKGYYCGKDLEKAKRIYDRGWTRIVENFNIDPDIQQWEQYVERVLDQRCLLGADIEATGLDLRYAELVVIGFAESESEAMVYPFTDYGGERYWPEDQASRADTALRRLLKHGRFIFQNGIGYDIPLLRHRGYEVPDEVYEHDTMIMHHALDPELPHNIGFINSIYGKMPYWKDSFLTRKEKIHYTDQDQMKTYNARDCINLHQIMPPMMEALEQAELMHIYQRGMDVAKPIMQMHDTGLKFSESKYKVWKKFLKVEMESALDNIYLVKELPDAFNLNSVDHKRWLFFREPLSKYEKAIQELQKYEKRAYNYQYECSVCHRKRSKKFLDGEHIPSLQHLSCSKCKAIKPFILTDKTRTNVKQKSPNSAKYLEYKAVIDVMSVKPFVRVKGYTPLKTKGGDQALDKKELTRMLIAINKRIDDINAIVHKREEHAHEVEDLKILRNFNIAMQRYSKLEKLDSSFGKFPVWDDGYVRPNILVTGTATGRFSCKSPNLN